MTKNLPAPNLQKDQSADKRDRRSTSTSEQESSNDEDQGKEKLEGEITEDGEGDDDQGLNSGSVHQVQEIPENVSPFQHRISTDRQQNDSDGTQIIHRRPNNQTLSMTPTFPTKTAPPTLPIEPATLQSSEINAKTSASTQKEAQNGKRNIKSAVLWLSVAFLICYLYRSSTNTNTNPSELSKIKEENWRQHVDPKRVLPNTLRSNILASLKPISASAVDEKTVATLLILSENEEKAAAIGRCLLEIVNSKSDRNGMLPEIDFRNDATTKLDIDNYLLRLLKPDETIIGVLIRNIDNLSSKHSLERARLLFAYCDGENPKVPNRLIIMTASADGELRQKFAEKWVDETDFVDPLMARISGNTVTISSDEKSIC